MTNPTLIVMAAGIGSRYGGLKQVDPVGLHGEMILDYSVYDALRAGFDRVVFLIRRDIKDIFRDKIGRTIEQRVDTVYVFQELSNVPASFVVPPDRKKPWGTGHAVLSCKDAVRTPFAAINADDYYGATAFEVLAQHLRQAQDRDGVYDYSMVGYALRNTLSEHGYVARGVCQVTPDGYLADVIERTHIQPFPDGSIQYTENSTDWVTLAPETTVSLNIWGFTPSLFPELEARFATFLSKSAAHLTKAEYFLPNIVGELVNEDKARVRVLPTQEKWYGVTYQEDRPRIQAAIRAMIQLGRYPDKLWQG